MEQQIPIIVILNGAPGVGKSTTAKLLAKSSKNSVWVRGDDIKHWIVNRDSEDLARGLTYINGGACCQNYAKAGYQFIVFDYVFTKKNHVEQFIENSGMRDCCFLFTLIAPLQIIKQREGFPQEFFSSKKILVGAREALRSNRQPLGKAVDIAYNEIINNKADLGTFIDTEFLSPQLLCELINKSIKNKLNL